ncbi:MAG: beta-L-arabinofuranosidase domain-containing protein [Bacteroidota bacterium]
MLLITASFYLLVLINSCSYGKMEKDESVSYYGKFKSIPANAITPKGWLKQYLVNQRNGLTGHLENAGYPFNTVGWAADSIPGNKSVEKWWPYEQNAYWVDGMMRCGLLLNDTFLLNKARKSINYVLGHPDSTGFLGPKFTKANVERDRWIHVIFFRAMMAEYEATKNPAILTAIKKHYLGDRFPHTGIRESVNAEVVLWAYAQSKDTALLNFAKDIYNNSNKLNSDAKVSDIGFLKDTVATGEHGVTYLEKSKLGAILFLYTGDSTYLRPSIAAFKKLDTYHTLVSGVNVSSEHIEPVTTQESGEICDISDYSWNIAYLLKATGNAAYADKIERVAFNAAPGSVTKDFKALQYFSAPNQVIAARGSYIRGGGDQMRYAPNPGTECCPGNVNRMMPNFAINCWMTDGKGGIAATLYAPSSVTYSVGENNTEVTIDEATNYPFTDSINFRFHLKAITSFDFYIRIPHWCNNASVLLNGEPLKKSFVAGTYIPLRQAYKEGDKVTVILPSQFTLTAQVENGIAVERGPLLYALKIAEDWQVDTLEDRSTPDFPAYQLFAKSPWNYALCVNNENVQQAIKVVNKAYTDNPWSIESAPIELQVPARLVNGWTMLHKTAMKFEHWDVERDANGKVKRWYIKNVGTRKGNWNFSPLLPDAAKVKNSLNNKIDTITLVPYGCSKLRVTVFPKGI